MEQHSTEKEILDSEAKRMVRTILPPPRHRMGEVVVARAPRPVPAPKESIRREVAALARQVAAIQEQMAKLVRTCDGDVPPPALRESTQRYSIQALRPDRRLSMEQMATELAVEAEEISPAPEPLPPREPEADSLPTWLEESLSARRGQATRRGGDWARWPSILRERLRAAVGRGSQALFARLRRFPWPAIGAVASILLIGALVMALPRSQLAAVASAPNQPTKPAVEHSAKMDWAAFTKQRPATPQLLTFQARLDFRYQPPFNDPEKLLCLRLERPESPQDFLYGYVERASPTGRKIMELFRRHQPSRASLLLHVTVQFPPSRGPGAEVLISDLTEEATPGSAMAANAPR